MNKFNIMPNQEGLYRVQKGRALHWPSVDGKPLVWARPQQFVDLRSPFLCEIVQRTGQMHKLDLVEGIPADGDVARECDIPSSVREAKARFEAGSPGSFASAAPAAFTERPRTVDLSQLPSAKAEDTEEAPNEATAEKAPRIARGARKAKEV